MPPTLILHGDADRSVPIREARKLSALFDAWGTPYETKIYPGAGHGLRGDDEKDAWRRTINFFGKHLGGNKEAGPAGASSPGPGTLIPRRSGGGR